MLAQLHLLPPRDIALIRLALQDVALTSAYPFDMRDQFLFISDPTVRGELAGDAAGT